MKIKKIYYILLFFAGLFLLFREPVLADQRGKHQYEKATQLIKKKQHDFALMEFRSIIRNFPDSKYACESLFAVGEYFYNQKNYYEATKYFTECVEHYPDLNEAVFARAYLLEITRRTEKPKGGEKTFVDDIEMEFFSKPLFLLFSEYREVSYKSAFQNNFTIRYYIDMIEVYKNDTLFVKITQ
ncbi:hypothetical protein ACFL0P_03775 [Candidatus Omnitrophota bacterium]